MTTETPPLQFPDGALARTLVGGAPIVVVFSDGGAAVATVDGTSFADLPQLLEASRGDASRIVPGEAVELAHPESLLAPLARPRASR